MSNDCVACGRPVVPAECMSWDDGEPIYLCADCCYSAEVDDYYANEMTGESQMSECDACAKELQAAEAAGGD